MLSLNFHYILSVLSNFAQLLSLVGETGALGSSHGCQGYFCFPMRGTTRQNAQTVQGARMGIQDSPLLGECCRLQNQALSCLFSLWPQSLCTLVCPLDQLQQQNEELPCTGICLGRVKAEFKSSQAEEVLVPRSSVS